MYLLLHGNKLFHKMAFCNLVEAHFLEVFFLIAGNELLDWALSIKTLNGLKPEYMYISRIYTKQ